jgi:arylsulfatase
MILRTGRRRVLTLLMAAVLVTCVSNPPAELRDRPNILLVVADDLGYSDISPFGSEIDTPTLAALADEGLIATSFYVSPRGPSTRAMLLTGVDHHLAGFGGVPGRLPPKAVGRPGYENHLNDRVVTVATLLRDSGYHTYMVGKWQLGHEPGQMPHARGFERSLALLDPMASYWGDMAPGVQGETRARYSRNGVAVESLPDDWYSTRSFADELITQIDADHGDGQPFFAYLAFQAPHSPLSVPEDWLEKTEGRYDRGYQAVQQRRLNALQRRELVGHDVVPFPGLPTIPLWSDLDEEVQKRQARKMELYAAMVENMDFHLGRVLEHLEEIGERDHTLVVFLSDNGASASDRGPAGINAGYEWLEASFTDSSFENWGRPGSFVEAGAGWGQTSCVPFRLFKDTFGEGGIRVPLVASGPGVVRRRWVPNTPPRGVVDSLIHVPDLPATFLEIAGVTYPSEYEGRSIAPPDGLSLVPILAGRKKSVRDETAIGFELGGDRALRKGIWKIVQMRRPLGTGAWRLYRLDRDPSELYDKSGAEPELLEQLTREWDAYASAHNVVVLPGDPSAASR